ncbi:large neutral amino acids transporter small subunit 2-like isoform X2 [Artemia franciscana]|uniref:large neutral amino acids transporter small subunit 2-like isoform X2 n=1 Tax=Artemia franciscana TaxID=6661 RepID=UPI0032DB0C09
MADPNSIQVNGRYGQAESNQNSNAEPGARDFLLSTNESGSQVKLKKELGLMEGTAIILGIIMGSGIFISPKGVLKEAGSVGFSIVVWILCGFLSTIGALCYAELGTSIPKSGGDYAYIKEALGPLPAFLYLWDANLIFVPTTNAIMGLTFANYVIKPLFPSCDVPDTAVRLIAAAAICFLTFLNCYDVKLTTKLQDVFMFSKLGALLIIIVAGIYQLFCDGLTKFYNPFEGTSTDPGQIAVSFYSGIFSYAGWNYLNFMTEELKDPYKTLPRAIYISLPLVTSIYVLANMAYLAVLTPNEMLSSEAIAVTFGDKLLGVFSWIMPVCVAMAAFGGLSVHIMTSSRLCFVGAREGHFPEMLALINMNKYTPVPSLVFLGILSLLMLGTSDIYALIDYASFVESMFLTWTIAGLIYMRYSRPDMERPIKVG